ncbi:hypothetical protein [Pseudoduganella armeniaca]|uniref:hypothetical protein n=1 Tax=Pseudoduganella armeniaca TaxID=2072590 RepID=UPI001E6572D1|nr:hypothetical protein [Pseudoduganella armeniaca]
MKHALQGALAGGVPKNHLVVITGRGDIFLLKTCDTADWCEVFHAGPYRKDGLNHLVHLEIAGIANSEMYFNYTTSLENSALQVTPGKEAKNMMVCDIFRVNPSILTGDGRREAPARHRLFRKHNRHCDVNCGSQLLTLTINFFPG